MVFADEEHTSVARVLRLRTDKDVGSLHLVDDAGDPWMLVRPGIVFAPNDRLADRRGRGIDRGR